ncbi:hypothetical protein [Burkholderia contaminans]|uniref:hypothetical protein n=1 Tax=Burkholderia contaminans TaxID=488447 RepID=UPI00163A76C9|nr:hypothetical protein [Burkholderia contaminans]
MASKSQPFKVPAALLPAPNDLDFEQLMAASRLGGESPKETRLFLGIRPQGLNSAGFPNPKDIICDPASGTCGFLVAAGEYGFGDEHINRILRSALLNPTLQLVIYFPGFTGDVGVGSSTHQSEPLRNVSGRREVRRIAGLPRQTAIIFGGSVAMPTMVRAPNASPRPRSDDAAFGAWAVPPNGANAP